MSLLRIRGLNQSYGGSHTLWDIDLDVAVGTRLCLMGRNGTGKTTLLKCIMGLIPVTSGEITFAGTDLHSLPAESRARLGVGYVPQGREIFPQLTVEENLKIGLAARQDRHRGIPAQVFELFPVLKQMLQRRGGDLSGGQQQQLAMGRALVLKPRLLILDEATEGIQPNIVQEIETTIHRLNTEVGLTLVLTEQHIKIARQLAHEFVIMDRGRIEERGPIGELTDELVEKHLTI